MQQSIKSGVGCWTLIETASYHSKNSIFNKAASFLRLTDCFGKIKRNAFSKIRREINRDSRVQKSSDDVRRLQVSDGLDVVLDGPGEVALGVEVISVLPEDVHQAVRVVVLRFGDSVQEKKLM